MSTAGGNGQAWSTVDDSAEENAAVIRSPARRREFPAVPRACATNCSTKAVVIMVGCRDVANELRLLEVQVGSAIHLKHEDWVATLVVPYLLRSGFSIGLWATVSASLVQPYDVHATP